jgi:hypothetical protein
MRSIRIGAGAGYSGDRIEPAVELAEKGGIAYLVFECLAERTIAIAQQARLADPARGYDPLLEDRMRAVLPSCRQKGIRIITNMGAANPLAAADRIRAVAQELGLGSLRVATVTGDDVLATVQRSQTRLIETGEPVADFGKPLVSANAYLGAQPLVQALAAGADVVVTGRVADPALFLAPLIHEFGWQMDDWDRLGKGTLVGHLLECAGQVTGGYFADPGVKDVAGLARLGFPIAEVSADGSAVITKVAGSGGAVTTRTVKEQLLYEIHDPARYLTPDVVADFSSVRVAQIGPDRVAVSGATGHPRPPTLKVSVGYVDSFVGEGQISYAGPNALARGRLARDIVAERLALVGVKSDELRFDLIGFDAIHGAPPSDDGAPPREVRLRVAGRAASRAEAQRIANEVEALYTNGPASGGGAVKSVRQVVAIVSTLIPRDSVTATVQLQEP